jgi:hypothetical protein
MSYDVDSASFGRCPECGDEIVLEKLTNEEVLAKKKQVLGRGGTCDNCDEGITAFEKQARHQIYQWLGPIEFKKHVATVIEPQSASHVVITLKDGRTAKIFRRGESSRELPEEIEHVFTHEFPDLKKAEKPWKK